MSGLEKLAEWAKARTEAFSGSGIENYIKRTLLAAVLRQIDTQIKNEQSKSTAKYHFLVTHHFGKIKIWEGPFDTAAEADVAAELHQPRNPTKKFLVMTSSFTELKKAPKLKANSLPTSPIRIGSSSR